MYSANHEMTPTDMTSMISKKSTTQASLFVPRVPWDRPVRQAILTSTS